MKGSDYAIPLGARVERWGHGDACRAVGNAVRGDRRFFISLGPQFDEDDVTGDELAAVDAELTRIVTAVNAHDGLVEALEQAKSWLLCSDLPCEDFLRETVDAALAKAKGDTDGKDV